MPSAKAATHATSLRFATKIDLADNGRQALVDLLNARLADTSDLYSQIKQAHWSVKGLHFSQLHELFDQLAGEIFPFIDLLAERVAALGGVAMGTARMAAEHSTLPEYPAAAVEGREHLRALIDRYGAYTSNIRAAIDAADSHHDKATADIFTGIARVADKQLWFLESHFQN
jgi:starvation-inducible DNA-binding protein